MRRRKKYIFSNFSVEELKFETGPAPLVAAGWCVYVGMECLVALRIAEPNPPPKSKEDRHE